MSSQEPPRAFTPGHGGFRPADDPAFSAPDHLGGFNRAIQKALEDFGRAPGDYRADLRLSATIHVENPGSVVEYIATFT